MQLFCVSLVISALLFFILNVCLVSLPKMASKCTRSEGGIKVGRYSCGGCERTFSRKGNQKQHQDRCKGAKEEANHCCDICGRVFARQWNVKEHIRTQHQNHQEEPRRSARRGRSTADCKREAAEDLERRLTNESYEFLELKDINRNIGKGVFATIPFSPREYVCRYEGELIDLVEAKKRAAEYEKDSSIGNFMYYFPWRQKRWCIDPTQVEQKRLGNMINHSITDSNLSTKFHEVGNTPCVYFVAKKRIKAGDQLLYDYGERNKDALERCPYLKY